MLKWNNQSEIPNLGALSNYAHRFLHRHNSETMTTFTTQLITI
jgi:hypothetical protein